MKAEYLLQKFIEHGEKMRCAQQSYYSAIYVDQKRDFLVAAKKAEKEFDQLLINAKQLTEK